MSETKQEAMSEGSEKNSLSSPMAATPTAKPIKDEPKSVVDDDDDDEDNVPLAFSRVNKKKKLGGGSNTTPKGKTPQKETPISNGNLSKVKKEEARDLEDEKKIIKGKTPAGKSNGSGMKVKKEEAPDSDDEYTPIKVGGNSSTKTSKLKKKDPWDSDDEEDKPIKVGGNSSTKISKPKKTDPWGSDDEEEKPIKDKIKKKKKLKVEERKVSVKVNKNSGKQEKDKKEKKERKVYDLPGQKHDPPEERDPLRIFYETLYQQVPNSEMAAVWMMEWGLLPPEEAKKIYEKKVKKGQFQKLGSPVKTTSVNRTTSSVSVTKVKKTTSVTKTTQKTKKRKASDSEDEDDDDDFMLSKIKRKKVSN